MENRSPIFGASDRHSSESDDGPDASQGAVGQEEFVRLLSLSYRSIYAYVRTLVPNASDAEDCVQEVCLQLWRRFDDYDREANFSRWARGFVRKVVKNYHRKARTRSYSLEDDLIDELAAIQQGSQELLELREEQLRKCLQRLSASDRKLLWGFYGQGISGEELAQLFGRTPGAIYQALRRARLALFRCINWNLDTEK